MNVVFYLLGKKLVYCGLFFFYVEVIIYIIEFMIIIIFYFGKLIIRFMNYVWIWWGVVMNE